MRRSVAQDQNEALNDRFADLKDYLEAFRNDLFDAWKDKENCAHSLDERHKKIQHLLSDVEDIRQNTQTFSESLEAHDGPGRPS